MALKTPTSSASVTSTRATKALAGRSPRSASAHVATRTTGTSVAVSARRASAAPSTPSATWTPNRGIQSTAHSCWNSSRSEATAAVS